MLKISFATLFIHDPAPTRVHDVVDEYYRPDASFWKGKGTEAFSPSKGHLYLRKFKLIFFVFSHRFCSKRSPRWIRL